MGSACHSGGLLFSHGWIEHYIVPKVIICEQVEARSHFGRKVMIFMMIYGKSGLQDMGAKASNTKPNWAMSRDQRHNVPVPAPVGSHHCSFKRQRYHIFSAGKDYGSKK